MDKQLILNLKIISKIPENGRVCRSEQNIICLESNTYKILQPFKRFFFQNSRKQAMNDISDIVYNSIERIKEITQSSYFIEAREDESNEEYNSKTEYNKKYDVLSTLTRELRASITGLKNLKITYYRDTTILSQIDIIIADIERFTTFTINKYSIS
jgi:hypothetical protein